MKSIRSRNSEYCKNKNAALVTYLLTNFVELSPSWEANRFLASQEILRILWNSEVHYRVHNSTPPVRILSQNDAVNSILYLYTHILWQRTYDK
jgi:hypothetical protein